MTGELYRERLLLFLPGTEHGGCEQYALRVARAARDRGYRVEACCRPLQRLAGLRAEFAELRIPVHDWCADSYEAELSEGRVLLARARPELVWMTLPWVDSSCGFLVACAQARIPGMAVWQLASEVVPMDAARAAAVRTSLDLIRWVAVCRAERSRIGRTFGVDESLIEIRPNFLLDETMLRRLPALERDQRRAALRLELGVPRDACMVVTVARLCIEQKGHLVLLEAIRRKLHALPELHFVWVGDGFDAAELRAAVRSAGLQSRISMLGTRSDVAHILSASDLFVLPSLLESMPFTIFEAMACDCPVIATPVGGVPEFITSGVHALLVDAGDADMLGDAVARLARDESLRHSLRARAHEIVSTFLPASGLRESFELLHARAPVAAEGGVRPGVARAG